MITDDKLHKYKGQPEPEKFRRMVQPKEEKFVPTCSICGEQHWPHHPSIPCIHVNKIRAQAKSERKAQARAEKKARARAKSEAKAKAKTWPGP